MADRGPPTGNAAGMGGLRGRHVPVVEDGYLLAGELPNRLAGEGTAVLGPAPRVDAALHLLGRSARLSLAVPDINLQGERSGGLRTH